MSNRSIKPCLGVIPCPGEAGSCFRGLPKSRLEAPGKRTLQGHGILRMASRPPSKTAGSAENLF